MLQAWALTEALSFSSSLSRFNWSCRWRAKFSSDILILLARIWDCTRARVCMHRKVVVAWRLTDCPWINDFNLTKPLRARKALLAWKKMKPNWRNPVHINSLPLINGLWQGSYVDNLLSTVLLKEHNTFSIWCEHLKKTIQANILNLGAKVEAWKQAINARYSERN